MSTVQSIQGPRAAAAPGPEAAPRGEARHGAALLPASTAIPGDAMAAMYMLMSQQRNSNITRGSAEVHAREVQTEKHLAEERAAHERQRAAEGDGSRGLFGSVGHIVSNVVDDATDLRVMDVFTDTKQNLIDTWNSPNFWKDVEKGAKIAAEVAAVVAASATTVVTFGAGAASLVAVGVLLSASAMADSELHVLEKCGVDAETAGYVDLGLAVGGAACNLGGGIANLGSTGAATAVNAGSHATLAEKIAITATVVQASATIAQGGAHVKTGNFAADATDAQADAVAARHALERSQRLEKFLLDAIVEQHRSEGKALESLQGAMQIQGQTMVIASGRA